MTLNSDHIVSDLTEAIAYSMNHAVDLLDTFLESIKSKLACKRECFDQRIWNFFFMDEQKWRECNPVSYEDMPLFGMQKVTRVRAVEWG